MSISFKSITALTALLLILVVNQHLSGFNSKSSESEALSPTVQPLVAVLTVQANRAILVNDAKTITGATILSGSKIETFDQVWATVKLGSFGILNIAPNTKLHAEFNQDGNVRVNIAQGCANLHILKGATAEIETSNGVAGKTNPNADGSLQVCFPETISMPVEMKATGGSGLIGLFRDAVVGIIAGHAEPGAGVAASGRGNNPGPSTP